MKVINVNILHMHRGLLQLFSVYHRFDGHSPHFLPAASRIKFVRTLVLVPLRLVVWQTPALHVTDATDNPRQETCLMSPFKLLIITVILLNILFQNFTKAN